ncbi:MAG: UpxY family transcription antiterminator [Chlorobi bacterium]|nr:UpxY family transcription antiterminator [Chlorobiota bacterium]
MITNTQPKTQNPKPETESHKSWYALYTKPRNEKKTFGSLSEVGIEAYLPLIKTLKQWSDRKKWVEEPLFRSYIFVHIEKSEYFNVLNINGIVRYITFEGKAVAIPENQIQAIKQYVGKDFEPLDDIKEFNVGDKVEVIKGSLMGLQGRLISIKNKQKVKIEIEAISQSVYLSVPKSFLEIIKGITRNMH